MEINNPTAYFKVKVFEKKIQTEEDVKLVVKTVDNETNTDLDVYKLEKELEEYY